ncbi:MAG: hypothetical protein ABL309_06745 [Phycisphaerales bacterium]
MRQARPSRIRRAFSLIEMVLSLSLVGLVLASLGSMLAFSMQAAPRPDDAVIRITDASLPLGIMTEEIGSAISISALTATSITFEVADRTGDGDPETITYDWGGTPGDPLTRDFNSEGATVVLDDVQAFEFEPDVEDFVYEVIEPTTGFNYDREVSADTAAVGKTLAMLSSRMLPIRLGEGYHQRIRSDAVPDGALYWTPDYVEVLLAQQRTPGAIRMELRLLNAGKPTATAIASRVVRASDLGSEGWERIDVPGEIKLDPNDELGLVLICIEGDGSVGFRAFGSLIFPGEFAMHRSPDGGDSWSTPVTAERMNYKLRSKFYGEDKRTSTTTQTVSSLRLTVSPLSVSEASIVTTIDLPAPVRITP